MPSDVIFNPEGGGCIIHRLKRTQRHAKCDFCSAEHLFLCDWHNGMVGAKTCDKKLCAVCTTKVGGADFCPNHAKEA